MDSRPRGSSLQPHATVSKTRSGRESLTRQRPSIVDKRHSIIQSRRYPPLTRDRLEKKNKLDQLILGRSASGRPRLTRRRSIANGYIYRLVHEQHEKPAPSRSSHAIPDVTEILPNVDRTSARPMEFAEGSSAKPRFATWSRYSSGGYGRSAPGSSGLGALSSLDHGFLRPHDRKEESNAAARENGSDISLRPNRRLSHLLKYTTSKPLRTRADDAVHLPLPVSSYTVLSTWERIGSLLGRMAERVIDSRSCEPAYDRMDVQDILTFAKYLHVFRTHPFQEGPGNEEEEALLKHRKSSATHLKSNRSISVFIDQVAAEEGGDGTGRSTDDDAIISPHSPTPLSSQNTSSTSDVDPLKPLCRLSAVARDQPGPSGLTEDVPAGEPSSTTLHNSSRERISATERQQDSSETEATSEDHAQVGRPDVTGPRESRYQPVKHFMRMVLSSLSALTPSSNKRGPIALNDDEGEMSPISIQFQGWSLWCFGPDSRIRLLLWRIIATRWFNTLMFVLLLAQWLLLSFVPIHTNDDKTDWSRPHQYGLLVINVIYTLEAIAKIIVYGFFVSKSSDTKPKLHNLKSLVQEWLCSSKRQDAGRLTDNSSDSSAAHLPSFVSIYSEGSRRSSTHSINQQSTSSSCAYDNQLPPWVAESSLGVGTKGKAPEHRRRESFASDLPMHRIEDQEEYIPDIRASVVRPSQKTVDGNGDIEDEADKQQQQHKESINIHHDAYLKRVANVLDIICIVSYWIDFSLMMLSKGERTWSLFKALAAARVLRLIAITEGTRIIVESLRTSLDMLCNVLGFFVFFWSLFSLMEMLVFMNSFSRRCAVMPKDGLHKGMADLEYVNPRVACSNYYDAEGNKQGVYDIDTGHFIQLHGEDGFACKIGQVCIQSTANQPGWGYINYNNIFYTMLNVFTVVSMEDWTELMYMSQDAVSNIGAAIFYCFCIYVMALVMVPMFIAAITSSFEHVRGDMRRSAFAAEKKNRLLVTRDVRINRDQDEDINEEWAYAGELGNGNMVRHHSHRQRHWAASLAAWKVFPQCGSIMVAGNIAMMMFYSTSQSEDSLKRLHYAEQVFNCLFAVEIVIRILGSVNWAQFWRYYRNRTDFGIVMATLIGDLVSTLQPDLARYFKIFAILRSYRLLYLCPRVLRLLSDVIGDGQGIINLTFFTFLVLFLLCPISIQLFGGDFVHGTMGDERQMRFDNFFQSFLALFQILTGENWTDILYDAMHSQSHASVTYAAVFMVLVYFTLHYTVLNLFIAVIMENFDLDEDQIRQIQIKKYIQQHCWRPEYFKNDHISQALLPIFLGQDRRKLTLDKLPQSLVASVTKAKFKEFQAGEPVDPRRWNLSIASGGTDYSDARSAASSLVPTLFSGRNSRRSSTISDLSSRTTAVDEPITEDSAEPLVKYGDEYEINVAKENKSVIVENSKVFRSLIFLRPEHPLRIVCSRLAHASWLNHIMSGLICTSIILAIWADAETRTVYPTAARVVEDIQRALLGVFWVDVVIRVIADGLIVLPRSYLRNAWNALDLFVLTCQTGVLLFVRQDTEQQYAYLRILRTLRSLRIAYHVEGIRSIFRDLLHGLPSMVDALALNLLVFVTFAIYGCYLFSGRFAKCNDDAASSRDNCRGEFASSSEDAEGIFIPRVWHNPYMYSFDDFGKALLHLFECASGEGWVKSLFIAMSVPSTLNQQPRFDWSSSSTWFCLYYIVFMFVASLCSIQLFIGVILEIFKSRSGISSLTNTQRQFQDLQRQLSLIKPTRKVQRPYDSSIRTFCYDLVIDKRGKFAHFMSTALTLNIALFASFHLHEPSWLMSFQVNMLYGFLALYTFEIVVKILGLGFRKWISSKWSIYDSMMTLLVYIFTSQRSISESEFVFSVVYHTLLVGMAFRLAQRIESLDTLFRVIKRSVPTIIYVTTAFAIVIVCFAVALQELFASTRYGPYGNNHANFRDFGTAVLTLLRITTGENWDFLMHDFTVVSPECVQGRDCGSPAAAIIMFVLYYIVCTYIFVNLLTVVVINSFSYTFDKRNQFTLITRTDLRRYKDAWALFDPTATGYISKKDVPGFLRALKGVLAIRIYDDEHSIKALLAASKKMDADPTHLASVPISEARLASTLGANNILGERFYNFYEVNRKLSTMDVEAVRRNKKRYAWVHQEIMYTAGLRGISFHDMLEILAMQLVDVTESLTFDALVKRVKKQDRIDEILATKKAQGLAIMLISRRRYLRERDERRDRQILNMSVVGDLLPPRERTVGDITERGDHEDRRASSVPEVMPSKRSDHDDRRASSMPQGMLSSLSRSPSPVPAIVVQQTQFPETSLRFPPRYPSQISSPLAANSAYRSRRASESSSMRQQRTLPTRSPSLSPPATVHPMAVSPFSSSRRATVDENIFSDASIDAFTRYYVSDINPNMPQSDAIDLINTLKHNSWSDMLHHQEDDGNQ